MSRNSYYSQDSEGGGFLAFVCIVLFLVIASALGGVLYIFKFADNIPVFFVMEEGREEWSGEKDLAIFENGYYKDSKIAPGMTGSYAFRMRNDYGRELKYYLDFEEANEYEINLVYRLRLDGEYVAGDENTYVGVDELAQDKRVIAADGSALYTLDWKWADGETDTLAGMNQATYTLKITFSANIFNLF